MKINKADYKGRVSLGSKYANKSFELVEVSDGSLALKPLVVLDPSQTRRLIEAVNSGNGPAYLSDGGLEVRDLS